MVEDRRAHERLDGLEKVVENHLAEHTQFERLMEEHTRMIKQIADNTAEMVAIFKGVKGFRTFFVWASPLVIGACAIWAWIKSNG